MSLGCYVTSTHPNRFRFVIADQLLLLLLSSNSHSQLTGRNLFVKSTHGARFPFANSTHAIRSSNQCEWHLLFSTVSVCMRRFTLIHCLRRYGPLVFVYRRSWLTNCSHNWCKSASRRLGVQSVEYAFYGTQDSVIGSNEAQMSRYGCDEAAMLLWKRAFFHFPNQIRRIFLTKFAE